MNYEQAKDLIRGPLVAMATPFKDNLDLDTDGLQHTVRLLIERGIVEGRGTLLVAAAAGEFPTMNREERMDAMRAAVEAAQGRVPILTSVQHTDIREIIALAKFADEIGITALQLGPTYYYHAPHDDMLRVFRTVGDAVKDVGIMIYNTCWNQPHMGIEMLSQLVEIPNVVAMKWAAPDTRLFSQGILEFGDRLVFVDNMGWQVGAHALGASAFVTHVGGFWPELWLEIYDALEASDYKNAYDLLHGFKHRWGLWAARVATETGGEGPFIKAALEMCGLPAGPPRPPSTRVSTELYKEGRQLMLEYGVPGVK
jgi:4-hydroxy-tetrahydrodipicolinate synthase